MNSAVGAAGRESSVDRVERDVVHGVHQRLIFCVWGLISAVTLEREVIRAILVLDVLYCDTTFNAADSKAAARGVGEAGHYTRLPLQGRCYGLEYGDINGCKWTCDNKDRPCRVWMDLTNCIFEYDARQCQRPEEDIAHPWCSNAPVIALWR
jgi:hypothetical protein